jgi:glycosyltransferase involved in cell wall biosynthesis
MSRKEMAMLTVTFNRRPYCEKTLSALLETHGHLLDLFVYDNGSPDDTPQYLKELEQEHKNVTVLYGDKNLGTAEATKILLKECVFEKGYSFICKNDDDELLPPDWPVIFKYWAEIEKHNAIMVGFKRKCTDDYFNGLKWVSRRKENTISIMFDDLECYLSYIVPGFQATTETWWKLLYPHVSDYGHLFGGWDSSVAMAIRNMGKQCLVVYNRLAIHFQKWEEHPEYTKWKLGEMQKVREKIFQMRKQGILK